MGSATVTTVSTSRIATMLRSLFVLAFAFAWMAASADVHAAKKDTSLCDGLTGAAKGLCTAAAALGCGEATKHQKQCDVAHEYGRIVEHARFAAGLAEAIDDQTEADEAEDRIDPHPGALAATLDDAGAKAGRNHADEMHAEKDDDAENEYRHGATALFEISEIASRAGSGALESL